MIRDVVVPVVLATDAVLIDGGTDSGVMRLVGRAHGSHEPRPPLIGVAVRQLIHDGGAPVEPNHTHLILVPGHAWGDESSWLSETASVVSSGTRAVTVLINGGPIALADVALSIAARRPVVVVAGTGRAADDVLADAFGPRHEPRRVDAFDAHAAAAAGLLVALDPHRPARDLRAELTARLAPGR